MCLRPALSSLGRYRLIDKEKFLSHSNESGIKRDTSMGYMYVHVQFIIDEQELHIVTKREYIFWDGE